MNKVILLGRVTSDIAVTTEGDKKWSNFTIAVHNQYKAKKAEEAEKAGSTDKLQKADFINCAAYKKNAENLSKYVKKGQRVLLEGSWDTNSYKTKEGETKYSNKLMVERVEFVELKEKEDKQD